MREVYFTKEDTSALKGFMALMILCHHVYQHTLIGSQFEIVNYVLRSFGYIGVAGFFFISGYGLTVANKRSNGEYFNGFVNNRLLPLYLINLTLIIIYAIFLIILSDGFTMKTLVQSFAFGNSIVPAGWYLQELLLFYVFYKLSCMMNPSCPAKIVYSFIIGFIFVCAVLGMLSHWYMSSLAFAVGVFIADNKEKINIFINTPKRYIVTLIALCLVIFVTYIICFYCYFQSNITVPLRSFIISPIFPTILFILSSRYKFSNQLLGYLGAYALELYVMQGLVFLLLKNNYWQVSNLVFLLATFPLLMFISITIHPLFQFIMTSCRNKK